MGHRSPHRVYAPRPVQPLPLRLTHLRLSRVDADPHLVQFVRVLLELSPLLVPGSGDEYTTPHDETMQKLVIEPLALEGAQLHSAIVHLLRYVEDESGGRLIVLPGQNNKRVVEEWLDFVQGGDGAWWSS